MGWDNSPKQSKVRLAEMVALKKDSCSKGNVKKEWFVCQKRVLLQLEVRCRIPAKWLHAWDATLTMMIWILCRRQSMASRMKFLLYSKGVRKFPSRTVHDSALSLPNRKSSRVPISALL